MYLKIICSWCRKFMGTKKCDGLIHEGLDITHSICSECKEKVMREIDEDTLESRTTSKTDSCLGGQLTLTG
jgi:hypothetical protein